MCALERFHTPLLHPVVHPDMQFVTNFTRIGFQVVNFTPQNIVIYDTFHIKNDVILKKIMSFTLILPKIQSIYLINHPIYTHLRRMHLNITTKQQEVNLQLDQETWLVPDPIG